MGFGTGYQPISLTTPGSVGTTVPDGGDEGGQVDTGTVGGGIVVEVKTSSYTPPIAGFSYVAKAQKKVVFTNSTLGVVLRYSWNFGDGYTSSDENPVHQYSTTGTFTAKLTATGAGNATDIAESTITVTEISPSASFATVDSGLTIFFVNNSTVASDVVWDFGDGSTSAEDSPSHTYSAAGTYHVQLSMGGYTYENDIVVTLPAMSIAYTSNFVANGYPDPNRMNGIAADENYLYICSLTSVGYWPYCSKSVVQIYNRSTSAYIAEFGAFGSGDGEFGGIARVTIDGSFIYVCDTVNNRIQVFNKTNPYAFVGQFGSSGSGDGQFNAPSGISVDTNFIYVTDYSNNRVQIFNKTAPYAFVGKFGSSGTGDGQFQGPGGIFVDDNYIYVSNTSGAALSGRIQIFNKASPYSFVGKFGSNGSGDGQFSTVPSLAVDDNYVYISDRANYRIQIFDKADPYSFKGKYGAYGSGNGQFNYPADICVYSGKIYITDLLLAKEQEFSAALVDISLPAAIFTPSTYEGDAPLTVNFTNSSTGTGLTYAWSFGDGTTSTSENPSCTYAEGGVYFVRLIVTDTNGFTSPATKTINVLGETTATLVITPPIAALSADVMIGTTATTFNFTDGSTGTPASWDWNWGDGTAHGTTQNPSHGYISNGNYTVTLTVTDANGWTSSASLEIIVSDDITPENNAPTAVISANGLSATSGFAPLPVDFSADVSTVSLYEWDFGDGSTSTEEAPSHIFTSPGTYEVTLTVSNIFGSTTASITIIVVGEITIDRSGDYYYIVDRSNHKVLVYYTTGTYYGWFGGYGSSAGKLSDPTCLVVNKPTF
jgi:PKD repeat protein